MEKKIGLFLDDERMPADVTWVSYPDNVIWIVARSGLEFHKVFDAVIPDYISFDHDMQEFHDWGDHGKKVGQYEITGYDVLKVMVDQCFDRGVTIPQCFFHTQNPIGKKNMEAYYLNAVKFQEENK